jgi:predicted nucleic-acid-binding protein
MIGLDTNVLIRFLVEDDEEQCRRARELIEKAVNEDEALYVSDIVMCETVWVLSSAYGFPRPEIHEALLRLLAAKQVVFDSSDRLARAFDAFRSKKGDFADYLIREHGKTAGCSSVATFDQALLKEPGFFAP